MDDCAGPDGHGTANSSLAAGATFRGRATGDDTGSAERPAEPGVGRRQRRYPGRQLDHQPRPAARSRERQFPICESGAERGHPAVRCRGIPVHALCRHGRRGDEYWGSDLPRDTVIVAGTDVHDTAMRDDYGPALTMFAPSVSVMGAGLRDDRRGFTPPANKAATPLPRRWPPASRPAISNTIRRRVRERSVRRSSTLRQPAL